MADGGQTVDQWDLVEMAARILARAFGTGYGWAPLMQEARIEEPGSEVLDQSCVLAIAKRGPVIEQAAKSIDGCRHVRRQHRWSTSRTVVAIPSYRHDTEAIAALSFAKLDGPLEAILLLYATGGVNRYWPTVKRFGLARKPSWADDCAITDAMQRILCGRAAISQDDRARELRMRASAFRELTREYERRLLCWLGRAASAYLVALGK
ncbi:hypothetical protein SAMN04487785_102266 [Dyella jiangningensis]|nr:hypothetical protein BDW41_102266 [Dyella sp. AtDHG13]SDJ49609.1 hypothetical protein SAMN04487785_102266 [Dyella jiangningensis]